VADSKRLTFSPPFCGVNGDCCCWAFAIAEEMIPGPVSTGKFWAAARGREGKVSGD
jgi:hypothetical protein